MTDTILLDGYSLTIEQLVRIAREGARVEIDPSTEARVAASEQLIAQIVENYRKAWEAGEPAATEYGVTIGFGKFKDKPIAPADLRAAPAQSPPLTLRRRRRELRSRRSVELLPGRTSFAPSWPRASTRSCRGTPVCAASSSTSFRRCSIAA